MRRIFCVFLGFGLGWIPSGRFPNADTPDESVRLQFLGERFDLVAAE